MSDAFFPPIDNPSNAPAKLRRACAAYHSATDLPRAGSFSRLLARPLLGQPPDVGEVQVTHDCADKNFKVDPIVFPTRLIWRARASFWR